MRNYQLIGLKLETFLNFAHFFWSVFPVITAVFFVVIVISLRLEAGQVRGQARPTQGLEIPATLQLSERGTSDQAQNENPLALAMGRRIVLENWTAYRNEKGIWVRGKLRNTARSPLNSPLYAIANFYTAKGQYLGSQKALVTPRPLTLELVGSFQIFQQPEEKPTAEVVRLRFRVTLAENQGEIDFSPTTRKSLSLKIKNLPEQKQETETTIND